MDATFLSFENLADLLQGCWISGFVPPKVVELDGGGWGCAVPDASPESLQHHAIRAIPAKPLGRSLSIEQVLGSEDLWIRYDAPGPRPADCVRYDPRDRRTPHEYILCVRGEERAQALLDELTDSLSTGLLVNAIADIPSGNTDPSDRFYAWRAKLPAPDFLPFESADEVFWRIDCEDDRGPFFQWPFELRVPKKLLDHICGARSQDIVVLARGRAAFRIACNLGSFRPLVDVSALQTVAVPDVPQAVSLSPDPRARLSFTVDLRLARAEVANPNQERILQLEEELRIREVLLDELRADEDESLEPGPVAEPLFIYDGSEATPPWPLRRLLVEWSDQTEALGRLRYHRVRGRIPRIPGENYHVVTTAHALGEADGHAAGLRLRNYEPEGGGLARFERLETWAQFGLYLFVPQGQRLRLYPDLPSTEASAAKLAQVLLARVSATPTPSEWRHWAVLLLPQPDGRLMAWPLPASRSGGLTSLLAAHEWRCAIETTSLDELKSRTADAGEAAAKGFAKAISEALHGEATAMVSREREKLARQMVEMKKKADALGAQATSIDKLLEALVSSSQSLLARLRKEAADADATTAGLEVARTTLDGIDARLAELRAQVKALRAPPVDGEGG
jgi:hypothetical protein